MLCSKKKHLRLDFPPRVNFYAWFLQLCINDPVFLSSVLFADEPGFNRDRLFNSKLL